MRTLRSPARRRRDVFIGWTVGAAVALMLPWTALQAQATPSRSTAHVAAGLQRVSFHGYQVRVPTTWRVIDFTRRPHACLRYDEPAVYVGHAGDQSACPSHLIGGAPGLQVEPLDARSAKELAPRKLLASATGAVPQAQLPARGPVQVAVQAAGVLVTAVYGAGGSIRAKAALASGRVAASAKTTTLRSVSAAPAAPATVTSPGRYLGQGFDACTAPSQSAMHAWRIASPYRAVGVYIGGVNRGCGQPQLTPNWVSHQVASGWHLIPTYVGLQAPCTSFYNRTSYDAATARAQGRIEGRDAVAKAGALGIAPHSTLYSDIEGYDSTNSACVTAVLNYLSGWTHVLHGNGYRSGVYSSASSGIRDLSTSYNSPVYIRPDSIWLAWWNDAADVNSGPYAPATQWRNHQRIHQFAGNVSESYGGYRMSIDRDFLDVGSAAAVKHGCPTNLNFTAYPTLRPGSKGAVVLAAQCLLTSRGFYSGAITGTVDTSTGAAISTFKSSHDLVPNSTLGSRPWTALLSAGRTPILQMGSAGKAVSKLQRALTASLGQTLAVNGSFGRRTRQAVKTYQTTHNLTVDGTVKASTWRALQTGL